MQKIKNWAMGKARFLFMILRIFGNLPLFIQNRKSRKNQEVNSLLVQSEEGQLTVQNFIERQRTEFFSKMGIGWGSVAQNGCGCIAVSNLLRYFGKEEPFFNILKAAEKKKALMGFGYLGCDPFVLVKMLKENWEMSVEVLRSLQQIFTYCRKDSQLRMQSEEREADVKEAEASIKKQREAYILCVWNEKGNPLAGSHTVAVTRDEKGMLLAHNAGRQTPCRDFEELFQKNASWQPILLGIVRFDG